METIIVTGGAGFIGSNFVRLALARTAARLVVVDKLTYAGNLRSLDDVRQSPHVVFIQADIADREAMEGIFRTHQPTAVVNFAAESHVDRSIDDPRSFIETNIVGAFVLLETAQRYLAESETTPYAPNSPYAASKASADHLVRAYYETYGLPTLITNCSNNYGPYQFPEKLIPLMLLNAVEGKPLPIYGTDGNVRDWLYMEDHCAGILFVLRRGQVGEKYNLGGGNERTNLEIVDRICALLQEIVPAATNPVLVRQGIARYEALKRFVPDRPGHDWRYAIDATKVQAELGWTPAHDFDQGLVQTIRWYLDHRDWCDAVLADKYDRERLGLSMDKGQE